MSCVDVQACLDGAVDGVLVDLTAHLSSCTDCRTHADALEAVDALAAELPELTLPPGLAEATLGLLEVEWAAADLPELAPPTELVDATLAAMDAELAQDRPSNVVAGPWMARWGAGIVALAAAALALVVVLPSSPSPGERELVQKGVGEGLADVSLKVAVDQDGALSRLSRAEDYGSGDTLYFRAQLDRPAQVALLRIDASSATVVHQGSLPAGEDDLRLGSAPLAWRIEDGEGDAVFALVALPAELAAQDLANHLTATAVDPEALANEARVCKLVSELGARCTAVSVGVSP